MGRKKNHKKKKVHTAISERRGQEYFSKGDYRQAINEWKSLVKSESVDDRLLANLAEAYFQYGISFYKENQLEAAKANLSNAVKFQPDKAIYLFHLGLCLHKANQMKEAINAYRKTLRLDPNNDQIISCLALACLRSGQTREAISLLKSINANCYLMMAYLKENRIDDCRVLLEDLKGDERPFFEGFISLRQDEVDKALPLLKKASQTPTFKKIASYYLAVAHIRNHQLEEAAQALEVVHQAGLHHSRIDKNSNILCQKLGLDLIKEGRNDEAIRIWERLLEIDPQNEEVRHNLSHAYYLKGNAAIREDNTKEAVDYWLKAEVIDDTKLDILHNLALAFDKIQDSQQSRKYWLKVISGWRKAAGRSLPEERLKGCLNVAYRHLAENYLTEDEIENAITAYKRALGYDLKDIRTRFELGELYLCEDRIESAIKEFKEVLKQNPRHIEALNSLGLSYDLDDQPGEAIKYWEKVIELTPEHPFIKKYLASAYSHQSRHLTEKRRFEEALLLMDKLDELCGKGVDSYFIRGFIYLEMNELTRADKYCQQAVRLSSEGHLLCVEIGDRYLDRGLEDKAKQYFREAIKRSKKDPFIYYRIGMFYCQRKLCKEAHNYFDWAIKKAPPFLEIPHKIGKFAFEEMHCYEGSKQYLEIAVKMTPDDAEIQFKLGLLCLRDFEIEKAEERFEIAEKLARDEGDRELVNYINRIRKQCQQGSDQRKSRPCPAPFF
ncbi:MAG: tetratricopeptide repeat protein [bacterium]|nr:tetratricopeptide repeat protein [bacterium]